MIQASRCMSSAFDMLRILRVGSDSSFYNYDSYDDNNNDTTTTSMTITNACKNDNNT